MAIKQYWCTLYRWSKSGYKNQCREKNCKSSASGGIRTHDLQDFYFSAPTSPTWRVSKQQTFTWSFWITCLAVRQGWHPDEGLRQQQPKDAAPGGQHSCWQVSPNRLIFSNGTWSLFFWIILGWIFHLSRNIKSLFQSILRRIELEEVFQNTWDFVLDDIKTNLFNRGTCSSKHL